MRVLLARLHLRGALECHSKNAVIDNFMARTKRVSLRRPKFSISIERGCELGHGRVL